MGNKPVQKFANPLLTDKEIKDKTKKILAGADIDKDIDDDIKPEKQETHAVMVRIPIAQYKKMLRIQSLTGKSLNAICLDFMWNGIKQTLKELEDE